MLRKRKISTSSNESICSSCDPLTRPTCITLYSPTHRIFRPLLAFVSTFRFTFRLSFWSSSHCLKRESILIVKSFNIRNRELIHTIPLWIKPVAANKILFAWAKLLHWRIWPSWRICKTRQKNKTRRRRRTTTNLGKEISTGNKPRWSFLHYRGIN